MYIVGENQRFVFDDDTVFIYREPTASEIVNYTNSIQIKRKGKAFQSKAGAQQLALADTILIDVEGFGYRGKDGKKIIPLNKDTKPEDIAHLAPDGIGPPITWKYLIPATRKQVFIGQLIQESEEDEKN
jgi:hypothetical protein